MAAVALSLMHMGRDEYTFACCGAKFFNESVIGFKWLVWLTRALSFFDGALVVLYGYFYTVQPVLPPSCTGNSFQKTPKCIKTMKNALRGAKQTTAW